MSKKRVGGDLGLVTVSQVGEKAVGYALLAVLARYLGKVPMGQFFFATSLAGVVAMLTELGLNKHLLRDVSEDPDTAAGHLSAVLALRLPLVVVAFALINLGVFLFEPDLLRLMLLVSAFVLLGNLYYSFGATLLGLRRVGSRVAVDLIGQVALAGLVLGAVLLKATLMLILVAYLAASVILLVAAFGVTRARVGPLSPRWDPSSARRLAREAFPFFLLAMLGVLHFKVDTLMLFALRSPADVADYEAGYKLLEVSRVAVRPAAMIFFPICARLAARAQWLEVDRLYRRLSLAAAAFGIAGAAAVIAGAGIVVPIVWGPRYADTIPVLRVLFLALPAVYVGFVTTFLAGALHLERAAARCMAVGLVVNVAFNAVAIPGWGAVGAAWATVLSHSLVAAWLLLLGSRKVRAEGGRSTIVDGRRR